MPDRGHVVEDGAEAQPDAVALPLLRDVDLAPVVADPGAHAQVRELGLPGRRHDDLAHLGGTGHAVLGNVEEFPRPIEAHAGIGHPGFPKVSSTEFGGRNDPDPHGAMVGGAQSESLEGF